MDTRKTTLIATIALIALLAVGIGYAYTAYTENAGNSTETSYVTITQLGTGYTFATDLPVQMDTYSEEDNEGEKIYYRLNGSQTLTDPDTDNTYVLKNLGIITLHAAITGTNDHPDLVVSVSGSTKFDATDNWFYVLGSAPNNNNEIDVYAVKKTSQQTSAWTAGGDTLTISYGTSSYVDEEVYVYYGYDATNVIERAGLQFMAESEMPKDLEGASLILVANSVEQP